MIRILVRNDTNPLSSGSGLGRTQCTVRENQYVTAFTFVVSESVFSMVFSGKKYKIIIMFGVIRDEECKIKSDL